MHVSLNIGLLALVGCWYIVIDDQLSLRDVDTSCNQIGCDQHLNFLFSELMHDFISLLFVHPREHNECFEPSLIERFMDSDGKILGVNENESLRTFTRYEHLFDKVKLLLLLNSVNVLLNRVDSSHRVLCAHFHLNALSHKFIDDFINLRVLPFCRESGRK